MPLVEVDIGGRSFEVACQDGEEPFLRAAARLLDTEAQALSTQIGRMPETKMLLMAGLLLADKTAALEERLNEAEAQLLQSAAARDAQAAAAPVRVEVPVLPRPLLDALAEIAAQAEALAEAAEERIAVPARATDG